MPVEFPRKRITEENADYKEGHENILTGENHAAYKRKLTLDLTLTDSSGPICFTLKDN